MDKPVRFPVSTFGTYNWEQVKIRRMTHISHRCANCSALISVVHSIPYIFQNDFKGWLCPSLWNHVPLSIRSAHSVTHLKKLQQTNLYSKVLCYCKVCVCYCAIALFILFTFLFWSWTVLKIATLVKVYLFTYLLTEIKTINQNRHKSNDTNMNPHRRT